MFPNRRETIANAVNNIVLTRETHQKTRFTLHRSYPVVAGTLKSQPLEHLRLFFLARLRSNSTPFPPDKSHTNVILTDTCAIKLRLCAFTEVHVSDLLLSSPVNSSFITIDKPRTPWMLPCLCLHHDHLMRFRKSLWTVRISLLFAFADD